MTYWERPSAVPGAVLWARTVGPAPLPARILPDGCMDLIWDGRRLFIAGPDSAARWVESPPGTSYVALRFSGGTGPALLGVPADEVVDTSPDLEDVWPSAKARVLAERVATSPMAVLEGWAALRSSSGATDPLGPPVMAMAVAGTPVAAMAARLGLSPGSCTGAACQSSATVRGAWRECCGLAAPSRKPGVAHRSRRSPPGAATRTRRTSRGRFVTSRARLRARCCAS